MNDVLPGVHRTSLSSGTAAGARVFRSCMCSSKVKVYFRSYGLGYGAQGRGYSLELLSRLKGV